MKAVISRTKYSIKQVIKTLIVRLVTENLAIKVVINTLITKLAIVLISNCSIIQIAPNFKFMDQQIYLDLMVNSNLNILYFIPLVS